MKFREWMELHEAGRVFTRSSGGQNRHARHNTDLPIKKGISAVGSGLADSLMQSQQKSGAEFHGVPSLPDGERDVMKGGEILNDQGVTHAALPLQIQKIYHNDKVQDALLDVSKIRTIDKMDRKNLFSYNPKQDGLYILWDPKDRTYTKAQAEDFTGRLADEQLRVLMTASGEINKVDPKPAYREFQTNDQGVLEIVYQFKPKKGGK